jgi:hypothetical protein
MWNAALAISYRRPIPGREAKALEVFSDALTLFGKLAADGVCADPEVFHHLVGGGTIFVKTDTIEKAVEILEMEDVRRIIETALLTVDEFDTHLMLTGEKVLQNMTFFGEISAELGYV